MDFEISDWKLIEFVGKCGFVTREQILRHFKGETTYMARLSSLRGIIDEKTDITTADDGSIMPVPTGLYFVSDSGKRLLRDRKEQRKKDGKPNIAILISIFALLVSLLANLDRIQTNLISVADWLKSLS